MSFGVTVLNYRNFGMKLLINHQPIAQTVICDGEEIIIRLIGDSIVRFPITVSAILQVVEPHERINCHLMPGGTAIEWPELDEHLSIAGLIEGRISRQSLESARRWLERRNSRPDSWTAAVDTTGQVV